MSMNRQERYQYFLKLCSELQVTECNIPYEFAKVAAGKHADDEAILKAMQHMRMRLDCGDFRISILLRLLYLYPDTELVQEETKEEIKDLLLDFDYWFGENTKYPGSQIIWTENHVMLFMVCEYLAGQLYPQEHFRFRNKMGAEAAADVRGKIIDWLDMKLRVGFSEWDSNCYADEDLLAVLNVYDFAEDAELKRKAKALIDVMTFSLAVNSYKGNYCCTHGRTYVNLVANRMTASTTLLQSLLWDVLPLEGQNLLHLGSLALATSSYEPQPLIEKIALDNTLVYEDFEQQSFDVEDAPLFGKGYEDYEDLTLFWHNMSYSHIKVVDQMCEMCEKFGIMVNTWIYPDRLHIQRSLMRGEEPDPCRLGNYLPRVNKVTYKTPDYLLSCAQDFRKGHHGFQQHIWQATLDEDAVVFTTHPGALGTNGEQRPNFWVGNLYHPKAMQYRDAVICIYNTPEDCRIPFSHAYFPKDKFDEVYEVGSWIFGRKAEGYVALYSQNGYEWSTTEEWQGKELHCRSRKNIWICQMGRKAEYGSFALFISEVLRSEVACEDLSVCYQSARNGVISCGWDSPLKVNGEAIQTEHYKRFDNPFCHSEYLDGKYDITYGGETLHIEM